MTVLEARAVSAGYGPRRVLDGVDVVFRSGELAAVVGPNGSGKTTLLRTLAGLLRPSAGEVMLDDLPLAALSPRERARRIATVPQTFITPFVFTGREVVALGRTPYAGPFGGLTVGDHAAVERALRATECVDLAERPLSELSGGERQRVVIAMALAQEADVLLLDEPTVHLDPAHQRAALKVVRELAERRGLVAVAVLHDLNLAAALCTRVVALAGGRVARDGIPDVVLDEATVSAVFGEGLVVGRHDGRPFVLPRAR